MKRYVYMGRVTEGTSAETLQDTVLVESTKISKRLKIRYLFEEGRRGLVGWTAIVISDGKYFLTLFHLSEVCS